MALSKKMDENMLNADLSSGVDDIAVVLDSAIFDTLRKRTLDGRIIRLNELVVDELDHKR